MKFPRIDFDEEKLIEILKMHNIKEVYLFGSILTESFGPHSDIDILITYKDNKPIGLFQLLELKEELANIYQRDIDLIEKDGLRNPYRRESILRNARLIYAA